MKYRGVGGGEDRGLVSVVIPARDEAAGIGRTVRAVPWQRAPGVVIEVVVVDDGSGDGTAVASRDAGARVFETIGCWVRVGVLEPIALLPALLAARLAYAAGTVVGGMRWLARPDLECRAPGARGR